jgi:hypothetical protein
VGGLSNTPGGEAERSIRISDLTSKNWNDAGLTMDLSHTGAVGLMMGSQFSV